MLSDIEIAKSCKMKDIGEIAAKLGLSEENIERYGKYKAKICAEHTKKQGKLILVTAINPTASGEGKTTVSIGLADGMAQKGVPGSPRAFPRPRVRHQGGRRGRRLRAGRAHGGHQPALYG